MTFSLGSISPSVKHGFSEKNLNIRQEIPKFVRQTEAGITDRTPVASRDSTPHNLRNVVRTVYDKCETLGMAPGEFRGLTVEGQPMVLYRTRTGDAYVMQKPEDARAFPPKRNGLHIGSDFKLTLDQENITLGHPRSSEALTQAIDLMRALS
jgi:hypothetical protein